MYLCQKCGSSICPVCRIGWFCRKCSQETAPLDYEPAGPLQIGPVSLLFVAVALILLGFALVFLGSSAGGGSGGCFFWPLPFIVGCGFGSGSGILGGTVFFVLVLVAILVSFWLLSARWSRLPP